jgi:alanine dehydrogenase
MIIGVPKEVKKDEYRVALLPVGAELLTKDGHTVLIEKEAGSSSGFEDQRYAQIGARIVESAEEIYTRADLIVKVKEPQPPEIANLRQGQVVFCYFHFASSRELTADCLDAGITAVAYETLQDAQGRLPLLTPIEARSPAECRSRRGPSASNGRRGAGESCSGASPAWHPLTSSSSAAGSSGPTPPGWPPDWERTSPSWTSTWTDFATSAR